MLSVIWLDPVISSYLVRDEFQDDLLHGDELYYCIVDDFYLNGDGLYYCIIDDFYLNGDELYYCIVDDFYLNGDELYYCIVEFCPPRMPSQVPVRFKNLSFSYNLPWGI